MEDKYKSVRISQEDYQALKKILHKKELNSVIQTIHYLVNKELANNKGK